jgi:hypothetical protein
MLDLEDKTRIYWNVSSAYNGRPSPIKKLTAERAFKELNTAIPFLDPNRPVSKRLIQLRDGIVKGPEHENVTNMTANQ